MKNLDIEQKKITAKQLSEILDNGNCKTCKARSFCKEKYPYGTSAEDDCKDIIRKWLNQNIETHISMIQFSLSEALTNSDNEIISEDEAINYIIIYDDRKYSNKEIKNIIDSNRYNIADYLAVNRSDILVMRERDYNILKTLLKPFFNLA